MRVELSGLRHSHGPFLDRVDTDRALSCPSEEIRGWAGDPWARVLFLLVGVVG